MSVEAVVAVKPKRLPRGDMYLISDGLEKENGPQTCSLLWSEEWPMSHCCVYKVGV